MLLGELYILRSALVVDAWLFCASLTRDDAEARPAVGAVVDVGLVVAPPMRPVLVVGLVVALVPMRSLLAVERDEVAPATCADERVVAPPYPLTVAPLLLIEPAVLLPPCRTLATYCPSPVLP